MDLGSLYMTLCLSLVTSGGIELTVFSTHFKVEMDVVDIQSQRVDRFGKRFIARDKGYSETSEQRAHRGQ